MLSTFDFGIRTIIDTIYLTVLLFISLFELLEYLFFLPTVHYENKHISILYSMLYPR